MNRKNELKKELDREFVKSVLLSGRYRPSHLVDYVNTVFSLRELLSLLNDFIKEYNYVKNVVKEKNLDVKLDEITSVEVELQNMKDYYMKLNDVIKKYYSGFKNQDVSIYQSSKELEFLFENLYLNPKKIKEIVAKDKDLEQIIDSDEYYDVTTHVELSQLNDCFECTVISFTKNVLGVLDNLLYEQEKQLKDKIEYEKMLNEVVFVDRIPVRVSFEDNPIYFDRINVAYVERRRDREEIERYLTLKNLEPVYERLLVKYSNLKNGFYNLLNFYYDMDRKILKNEISVRDLKEQILKEMIAEEIIRRMNESNNMRYSNKYTLF